MSKEKIILHHTGLIKKIKGAIQMNEIQIKNRRTDEVIFKYKCENNTIKNTVEEAVKRGVNLSYANLKGADLSEANLVNIELEDADLSFANLTHANLSNANLKKANLEHVIACYTNFEKANLKLVNFAYSDL